MPAKKGTLKQPSFTSQRIRPTPLLADDVIVVERINRMDYQAQPELFDPAKAEARYGRPWPRDVFLQDQSKFWNFPDHVLTYVVEEGDDMILYYAKDRQRQELYNYGVKLSSQSVAHPILNRQYLVRRSAAAFLQALTADPIVSTALLVEEEILPEAPPELKGLYVIINRVYETLPGPVLTDYNYDEGGNLVSTEKQVVALPFDISEPTYDSMETLQPISVRKGVLTRNTMRNPDGSVPWDPSTQTWREILTVDENIPGSRVTIDYYYVRRDSAMPSDTNTITYDRRKHPTNPRLQIEIKKEYDIPETFYEIITRGYTAPRRLIGLVWDSTNTYAKWEYIPGFSANVPALVEHSFSTTMPTLADLAPFYVREAEWNFPFGFSGRALTDGQAINVYVGGTLVWAGPTLPSSTPSAAAYPQGQSIQDSGQASIYRAHIYHIQIVTLIAL